MRPARTRTTSRHPFFRRAALAAALACTALACAPRVTPPDPFGGKPTPALAPTPVVAWVPGTPTPAPARTPEASLETPCTVAEPAPPKGAQHTIRFLDIGQGDSALIKTASGKTVLVDAGDRNAGPAVLRELAAAGVTRLDLLMASHPHLDHIGGMLDVLDKIPVRLYVDPGTSHTTETYKTLLEKLQEKKIPYQTMRAGKSLRLGDEATLRVLFPGETLIKSERSNENANSLVVRLTIGIFDVLFTGDAEPETLDALMSELGPGTEVLKIAHHGSKYGTNSRFLRALAPKAAVISAAAKNDYGHPHPQTLALLREECVPTFFTGRDGTVTIVTDGAGWQVSPAKQGVSFSTAVPSSAGLQGPTEHARAPAASAGPVFASKRGKVYHPAGCPHIGRIKEENLVEYPTPEDAEQAGLHAGSGCRAGNP